MTQPYIVCPRCGMTSHNPNDVRERYCGNCHAFHDDMQPARDACQVCGGARGGVPGNENIINGTVMCDYCHAIALRFEGGSDA